MLKNDMEDKKSNIVSETRKGYSIAWAGSMIWIRQWLEQREEMHLCESIIENLANKY